MARWWRLLVPVALLLAILAAVAWYVWPPANPRGFSGLEFAVMTKAASARAPLLTTRGALILDVADKSPAARAGIVAGDVVAALDNHAISSAAQASRIVRSKRAGDQITLTLFDETKGDIHPRKVTLRFDAAPPPSPDKLTVNPPRILAREHFQPPGWAAGAAWSRRLSHGASIRPTEMTELVGAGCSGVAPEEWHVREAAPDLLHLVSKTGGNHAIFKRQLLDAHASRDPAGFVRGLLHAIFRSPVAATPIEERPFGFRAFNFGNDSGATGFAVWRLQGRQMSLWIAGVPASDVAWAAPLTGAVVFSMHCQDKALPRDASLNPLWISKACQEGRCRPTDYAADYMSKFRLGYVHAADGTVFLVNPRHDFWLNGQEGPGFYRQVGGMDEKLEPGRTN